MTQVVFISSLTIKNTNTHPHLETDTANDDSLTLAFKRHLSLLVVNNVKTSFSPTFVLLINLIHFIQCVS